jgi:YgiT-type zinc finger domain-containing protein
MPVEQKPNFGSCPCTGVYDHKLVEVKLSVDGETILLTDVPQGLCPLCGSRVYKVGDLERIEALVRGELPPRRHGATH